mmetsp:Transcript_8967/g.29629  ORF Transcript_8967/g.29629 Transcript_8967/m.29629 type:complete len:246 (-) Transcript_8967:342-1079(-)
MVAAIRATLARGHEARVAADLFRADDAQRPAPAALRRARHRQVRVRTHPVVGVPLGHAELGLAEDVADELRERGMLCLCRLPGRAVVGRDAAALGHGARCGAVVRHAVELVGNDHVRVAVEERGEEGGPAPRRAEELEHHRRRIRRKCRGKRAQTRRLPVVEARRRRPVEALPRRQRQGVHRRRVARRQEPVDAEGPVAAGVAGGRDGEGVRRLVCGTVVGPDAVVEDGRHRDLQVVRRQVARDG